MDKAIAHVERNPHLDLADVLKADVKMETQRFITQERLKKQSFGGYNPGGIAMPGRNVVGEYAETDPETRKVAFELRLYDPRINRWLTTYPAGQFHSSYMSMGNNWVSRVDPDGGYSPPTDFVNVDTKETVHVNDGIDQTLYVNDGLFQEIKSTNFGPDPRWFSPSYQNILFRAVGNDALQFGEYASQRFIQNFDLYGEGLFYSQIDKLTPNYAGYPGPVQTAANNSDAVNFGLKLVVWRQSTLRGDSGITNNEFEHQIGTFLNGQSHGTNLSHAISQLNEVQNIVFADRRNGNIGNALLARGGTAFEWKDVYNNWVGQVLSIHYTLFR